MIEKIINSTPIDIEKITIPIPVDDRVNFVPQEPHYFTISLDQQHGGLVCSYSGYFQKEGEAPLYDSAVNEFLPSQDPCSKLSPVYHDLKKQREKKQNV